MRQKTRRPILALAAALALAIAHCAQGAGGWECDAGPQEGWACFASAPVARQAPASAVPRGRDPGAGRPAAAAERKPAPDVSRLYRDLPWDYCGPRPARLGPAALPAAPAEDEPVAISADAADYDRNSEQISLAGDILVEQGSRQVRADEMTYDLKSEVLEAEGNTYFEHPGVRMVGSRARISLQSDEGSVWDPQYRFSGPANARGSAARADVLSRTRSQFEDISYTTCPPGRSDWSLQASRLEVDQETGRGTARDAKLRLGGVPVLYTPYLSFPIDNRRQSGILVPSFGSSDERGVEVTVPYYWNIAPNLDATFFPRYMSKRGLMLGTEVRFLTPRQDGKVFGEILPNDWLYDGDGPRGAYHFEHRGRYHPRLSSDIYVSGVSDDTYLQDFGNRLEVTSVRNLERRGDLWYAGRGFSLLTRVQDFQTVDRAIAPRDRPYARLPQLLLDLSPRRPVAGLELGLNGEYTYFDHRDNVYGQRLSLIPSLSWPVRRTYGYALPRINLYHTSYLLQDEAPGVSDNPSLTLASFNLDAKLIFERNMDWFRTGALQTLEPRVFYLYTPYEDQDELPVFDTSELTFTFANLFRPNRFTGRDRIGDANQLTLGLTSRTLASDSGIELFRASLGQILYFADRRVQLVGPTEDQQTSPFAAEVAARLGRDWSARAGFQWDPNQPDERAQRRAVELHYETPERRLLNLAYRFDVGTTADTRYEDTDLSLRWPVSRRLELVGRWYYSWLFDETLDAFAGLEYGQCCWRVRLLGRHFKNAPEGSGTNMVMVQVELAGLGALGDQVDKFLERSIYGYEVE